MSDAATGPRPSPGKRYDLISHPDHPPHRVEAVEVFWGFEKTATDLRFVVQGAVPLLPPLVLPERTDGLWRTTCFEVFIRPQPGDAYLEFNLSPSTRWAAYAFDGHRQGMTDLPVPKPPVIEPVKNGVRATLDLSALPARPWHCGLTAVVEETDGTKSYWALAHAPGPADFHNPATFTASLPRRPR